MTRKLLFAVDFSPYTEKLLGCAGELASVGLKEVILLNVLKAKDYVDYGDEKNPLYITEKREAEIQLFELSGELVELGLEVTGKLVSGEPARVIAGVAKEENVDLIFMGAHGRGFLDRFTIGSVSDRVLKAADRPVLIQHCRERGGEGGYTCENVCASLFGNVLVANDFSEYSRRVEPLLIDLSKSLCAPTTLLHVHEGKTEGAWSEVDTEGNEKARQEMEKLQQQSHELADSCRSISVKVIKGSPAEAILGYAEDMDATLVVLGAFGQRGVIKGMLGDVTERVVRRSDRPVLVLKSE